MTDKSKREETFYQGLKCLTDLSFPKICQTCGKTYNNAKEFIFRTESLRESSGLKQSKDYDGKHVVELFRNCSCKSTLLEAFHNRRDTSEQGIRRREKFGQLLDDLKELGWEVEVARRELIKVLRGKESIALKELGIVFE